MNMFYAVKKGKIPGIYQNWKDCKNNTCGFKGAEFHKFKTKSEAEEYINGISFTQSEKIFQSENKLEYPYAFIDGSFNVKDSIYGYGVLLKLSEESEYLNFKGSGQNKNLIAMRNISGEILGAIYAINKAIKLNLKEINIYYDYLGIEMWAKNIWNSKIPFIINYKKFIKKSELKLKINFIKVKSHSGINENELADKLAKEAVGL